VFITNFSYCENQYFERLTGPEKIMRLYNPYFLESYHYLTKGATTKRVKKDKIKIFIDSGAFTAFTKGTKVDLDAYIRYCHDNEDIIELISLLDEINPKDVNKAVETTLANMAEMERQGLKGILPTFHMGEPEWVLKYYAEKYPYISLGGMVGISVKQLMMWLDRMWSKYLTHEDGTPKIKVHGFGITSLPAMLRYPWYSVDSSTWVQWSAAGMILLPGRGVQLNVSNRSSFRKMKGQHLTTVAPRQQKILEEEIRATGGDPDRLAQYYYSRWAFNIYAFPRFLEMREGGHQTFKKSPGLFDEDYTDDDVNGDATDYDRLDTGLLTKAGTLQSGAAFSGRGIHQQ